MHHLYFSSASEVASSMTGMFDQPRAHSGGILEDRVQAQK